MGGNAFQSDQQRGTAPAGTPADADPAGPDRRAQTLTAPGQPVGSGILGPSLWAPNTDKNGVAYDIPATDFRPDLRSEFPPLSVEMPAASIPDPGAIPGWKTMTPERVSKFGPFEYKEPAKEYIVGPGTHSPAMLSAWTDYKAFLQEVQSTWNSDTRGRMNTYAQQRNGDPELQKLVDETKRDYNLASIKQGGGTFGQQTQGQQVTPGHSVKSVHDDVKASGQGLLDGAKASAAQPESSTVGSPVKDKVDKLNIAKQHTQGSVDKLSGTNQLIASAKSKVDAAKRIVDDIATKDAEKDAPPEAMVKAQAIAKKINPTLGEVGATLIKYREPIASLKTAATSGAKAAEGDPKAALEAVQALLAIARWDTLQKRAEEMKLYAQPSPQLVLAVAAADDVIALSTQAKGFTSELEANIKAEKKAYEALATELEKAGNWKGKDGADGKKAADALRGIPVCDRVLRVLRGMKGSLPKVPTAGTRAAQGYTLATKGVNAPGAAELHTVGSWIGGAGQTIDGEIGVWEGIRAQLSAVASALGVT